MNSTANKAVFLDRDGVVNRKASEGEYIRNWSEIQFLPGAITAVAALNRVGYQVFVVTNQRGISIHKLKIEDVIELHGRMKEEFARGGAVISEIYYCPHDISANCSCRKPQPGMLQRAAGEHNVDLKASWMIGDSVSDVEAGNSAGCRTILLASHTSDLDSSSEASYLARDLDAAVRQILQLTDSAAGFVCCRDDAFPPDCVRKDA